MLSSHTLRQRMTISIKNGNEKYWGHSHPPPGRRCWHHIYCGHQDKKMRSQPLDAGTTMYCRNIGDSTYFGDEVPAINLTVASPTAAPYCWGTTGNRSDAGQWSEWWLSSAVWSSLLSSKIIGWWERWFLDWLCHRPNFKALGLFFSHSQGVCFRNMQ